MAKEQDNETLGINEVARSGLLFTRNTVTIRKYINEGVKGRKLKASVNPSPINPVGQRWQIKKSEVAAYREFLEQEVMPEARAAAKR